MTTYEGQVERRKAGKRHIYIRKQYVYIIYIYIKRERERERERERYRKEAHKRENTEQVSLLRGGIHLHTCTVEEEYLRKRKTYWKQSEEIIN